MRSLLLGLMLTPWAWMAHGLEVNQAGEMELDGIRGVGPALSARILKARSQAPFRDWSDLMARVRGLGVYKAQEISQEGLRVNGHDFRPLPHSARGSASQP
ncbi:MAG: ComEA family DNA-binding protein [Limnohabitans sp.]